MVASERPPALALAAWGAIPGLVHGFFGRRGGLSAGDCASLNVSERVGDNPASVAANWRRVRSAMSDLPVTRMRQVHGPRVVTVVASGEPPGDADAMLAVVPEVALAVLTADCVPILGVAPAARAVMAVHAGWRGTLAGVVAEAVRRAQEAFGIAPGEWQMALGPAIGGCCYEVESSLGEVFTNCWGSMPDAWRPARSHGQLDLRRVNHRILEETGVPTERIVEIGPCTSCASADYFSHRRSGGRTGRQVSAIGWAASGPP